MRFPFTLLLSLAVFLVSGFGSIDAAMAKSSSLRSAQSESLADHPDMTFEAFEYDSRANRTLWNKKFDVYVFTYNSLNKVTGVSLNSMQKHIYTYDTNGSLIQKTDDVTTEVYNYGYDSRLKLSQVINWYSYVNGNPVMYNDPTGYYSLRVQKSPAGNTSAAQNHIASIFDNVQTEAIQRIDNWLQDCKAHKDTIAAFTKIRDQLKSSFPIDLLVSHRQLPLGKTVNDDADIINAYGVTTKKGNQTLSIHLLAERFFRSPAERQFLNGELPSAMSNSLSLRHRKDLIETIIHEAMHDYQSNSVFRADRDEQGLNRNAIKANEKYRVQWGYDAQYFFEEHVR